MKGIDIYRGDTTDNLNNLKSVPEKAYRESDFVIVKATQGVSYKYTAFFHNLIKRTLAEGKLAGAYHYAAGNDAIKEADYFISAVKPYLGQIILCLDWEPGENKAWGSKTWCSTFINRVKEKTGITCFLYGGLDACNQNVSLAGKIPLWFAGYPNKSLAVWDPVPSFKYSLGKWGQYAIWQYTSSKEQIDRNITTLTAKEWKRYAGSDSYVTVSVDQIINDMVDFTVRIASDNSHGYSQAVRSLYNINTPKSFDCSSLVLTAIQYAFERNGITPTPKSINSAAKTLGTGLSYTGNMLNLKQCGFEVVATNQTAHSKMQKGDLELSLGHHVAMAVDNNRIVHARSAEGTTDTKDGSGNEIRVQDWYKYSKGWTHRLRFTGKGLGLNVIRIQAENKKSIDDVAKEVLLGRWGNGDTRKSNLEAAGYDYATVQKKVNQLISDSSKKSVTEIAKEVINGKWGNGATRKAKLTAAGYNYSQVQLKVNQLLKRS